MKKITAAILAVLMLLSGAACKPTVPPETSDTADTAGSGTITEKETDQMTDAETEEPIVDEEPVFYEKIERDPIDPGAADYTHADWNSTIINANARAGGVSGRFTDPVRNGFIVQNEKCSLLYNLLTDGNKQLAGLYNSQGKPYFENATDAYIVSADGSLYSSAASLANARMNSHRLGYYYYDFRFCGHDFVDPTAVSGAEDYDLLKNTSRWSGNDVKKVIKKNGTLSFEVTSAIDPYVLTSCNFSADKYNAVRITLKTEYSSYGQIFLIAGSKKTFSAEQYMPFKFTAGQWITVTVPLSSIPDYNGTVTGFRIDCGYQAGEQITIKEITAISRGTSSVPLTLEHIFHTYSDKMHEVVRAVAVGDYTGGGRFESKTVIPADTVRKIILKNAEGEVSQLEGFDFSTAEYVAFDIKNAGVFGIIMPAVKGNGDIKVELKDGGYVITRGINITGTVKKGGELLFGHRLYTSDSHQFNDFRKEAYIERNPLTDVFIAKEADNAKYTGYDALIGCYIFTVKATEFVVAYKNKDKQFCVNALMCGDGVTDRTVYIQTAENRATRRGRLECAALLDENDRMLPIPLEVGKNFDGENEEPIFFPENASGAAAYGETYAPLTIGKDENKRFTMVHLYQNWGNYPLKQLSFIAFHIPYYHLSVGVTETNCITPYFVNGKDGWMLPDFRANSAPFWPDGVQHTSIGRLYFLQYKDADGNRYKTETQRSDISSSGPVYADISMDYLCDDGKIKATFRHAEMAQTDETRTFYNMRLEVLDDVNVKDFRNDFAIFTFDSFTVSFSKVGYLDENGNKIVEDVGEVGTDRVVKLGSEYPYFDYFGGNVKDSVNFGLIIRRSDITVGGKKYDGRFVFRDRFDGTLNIASLSLDLGEVTLKKGDVIDVDLILLPWGYSTSNDDSNVVGVREDSCVDPYRITVIEGEEYADRFIPSVRAVNNAAKFTISGGKSTAAVRIYGFTDYALPRITFKADGRDVDIKLAGVNGYDGYQVNRDDDGTYSFSFNVDMNAAKEYEITVKQ